MAQTVILTVGISGSGKSTRINKSILKHNQVGQSFGVCSADNYRIQPDGSYKFDFNKLGEAHKQCQKNFQTMLKDGVSYIYVDNTNLTKKERSFYISEATKAGANIFACVFPVNVDLCEARNIHNVPRATLENMAKRIDLKPGMYKVEGAEYLFLGELNGDMEVASE